MFWGVVLGVFVLCVVLVGRMVIRYRRFTRDFPRPKPRVPRLHPQFDDWLDDGLTTTWIGHSTVYLNIGGLRVLTDPVFSTKVGIRIGPMVIGPKRYTPAAASLDDLADKVDVILLSHAHLDHLDLPSLRRLANRGVQVITAIGTGSLLRNLPFRRVLELGGEGQIDLGADVHVEAVPVRHWGNRFPWNKSYQWTGYLISHRGIRVFFGGDTAYTPNFSNLPTGGPIHLAIFPIGAYTPAPFQRSHCTPEQAWSMFVDTQAQWMIPVHWNTFVLSQEPVEEPLQRLTQAAGVNAAKIVIHEPGAVFQISMADLIGASVGEPAALESAASTAQIPAKPAVGALD